MKTVYLPEAVGDSIWTVVGPLGTVLLLWLAAINLIAFLLMGVDKYRAIRKKWRIPERTLLGACALFGALGGYLGMQVFRHKTRHFRFSIGVPLMLAAQIALLAWLLHALR